MACSPGSIPTVLPGVNASLDWCATTATNTTNSTMGACCDPNLVQVLDGCAWCAIPGYYLNTSSSNADITQASLLQSFSSCMIIAGTERNASVELGLYCNAPNLPKSGASSSWARGRRVGWVGLVMLLACLEAGVAG